MKSTTIRLTLPTALGAMLLTSAAFAAPVTVTLDTVADCTVRHDKGVLTTANFGTQDTLYTKSLTGLSDPPYPNGDQIYKTYIRFELPDDIQTVTSAVFQFYAHSYRSGSQPKNEVYGLNESASGYGTGKLGEDWGETALNWDNAPSNSASGKFYDPAYVTLLGTSATVQQGVDAAYSVDVSSYDWAGDTNGLVTLMLRNTWDYNTSQIWIWSKEHAADGTGFAPQLVLTYEPVPEPATLALLGLGSLMMTTRNFQWRRRRA